MSPVSHFARRRKRPASRPKLPREAVAQAIRSAGGVAVERECGGWLVVSDMSSPVGIGFVGDTEFKAMYAYYEGREKWASDFDMETPDPYILP